MGWTRTTYLDLNSHMGTTVIHNNKNIRLKSFKVEWDCAGAQPNRCLFKKSVTKFYTDLLTIYENKFAIQLPNEILNRNTAKLFKLF